MPITPSLPSEYTRAGWIITRQGNALQPLHMHLSYCGPRFALDGRRYAQRRKERGEPPAPAIPPALIDWIVSNQPSVDTIAAAINRDLPDLAVYRQLRGRLEMQLDGLALEFFAAYTTWRLRFQEPDWLLVPVPAVGGPLPVPAAQFSAMTTLLATCAWSLDVVYTRTDAMALYARVQALLGGAIEEPERD